MVAGLAVLDVLVLAGAAIAAVAALFVVLRPDVLHSALALVVVLLAVAAVYAGLGAHFIAAIQVVVYAGAVVVLFLFAIMVLKSRREVPARPDRLTRAGAVVAGGAILGALVMAAPWREAGSATGATPPSLSEISQLLFREHLLAFELVGLLLLVSLVAVVVLARRPAGKGTS